MPIMEWNCNRIDVLGLGCVAVDFVGTTNGLPPEGSKQLMQHFSICDGGLVGTALVAVARLGGIASFAGKLGHSEFAERAVSALKREGVDLDFLIRSENAEPLVGIVITNALNGERTIFWTAQAVEYPFPEEFHDNQWCKRIGALLIDSEAGQAAIQAAKMAQASGVPVIIDVENDYPHVAEAMAVSSHVVVSKKFAADYTGRTAVPEMLESLLARPGQTVIITQGQKGCSGLTDGKMFELTAFKVDAVDTTGCGDVFHGAYALAIARGQTVREAAKFASAAASLCATRIGGREGIPSQSELSNFIRGYENSCEN